MLFNIIDVYIKLIVLMLMRECSLPVYFLKSKVMLFRTHFLKMISFITSIEINERFLSGIAKMMRRKQKTCELSSKYITCKKMALRNVLFCDLILCSTKF